MLPIKIAGHKSREKQSEQKIINQLNYTDMKNVSEKTLITCMVNLKCLGYYITESLPQHCGRLPHTPI